MYTDFIQRNQEIVTINPDIVSMAHSVEMRSPFLNQIILKYFWKTESSALIDARSYKKSLIPVLEKLNLAYLINRPKIGFDGGMHQDPLEHILNELIQKGGDSVFENKYALSPELELKAAFLNEYLSAEK